MRSRREGAHVATVTATDSAGVTASAQAPVAVTGGGGRESGPERSPS